jgi:Ca2+-binding EF-hand superfamily protein
MIKKADVDGNGQISYNEWLLTAVSVEKLLQEDKLESAFKLFDKDNSRTLTIQEIKDMLLPFNDINGYMVKRAIDKIDKKNKIELTFDEFKDFMI